MNSTETWPQMATNTGLTGCTEHSRKETDGGETVRQQLSSMWRNELHRNMAANGDKHIPDGMHEAFKKGDGGGGEL